MNSIESCYGLECHATLYTRVFLRRRWRVQLLVVEESRIFRLRQRFTEIEVVVIARMYKIEDHRGMTY